MPLTAATPGWLRARLAARPARRRYGGQPAATSSWPRSIAGRPAFHPPSCPGASSLKHPISARPWKRWTEAVDVGLAQRPTILNVSDVSTDLVANFCGRPHEPVPDHFDASFSTVWPEPGARVCSSEDHRGRQSEHRAHRALEDACRRVWQRRQRPECLRPGIFRDRRRGEAAAGDDGERKAATEGSCRSPSRAQTRRVRAWF